RPGAGATPACSPPPGRSPALEAGRGSPPAAPPAPAAIGRGRVRVGSGSGRGRVRVGCQPAGASRLPLPVDATERHSCWRRTEPVLPGRGAPAGGGAASVRVPGAVGGDGSLAVLGAEGAGDVGERVGLGPTAAGARRRQGPDGGRGACGAARSSGRPPARAPPAGAGEALGAVTGLLTAAVRWAGLSWAELQVVLVDRRGGTRHHLPVRRSVNQSQYGPVNRCYSRIPGAVLFRLKA